MTEAELLRSLPVLAFQSVLLLSRLGAAAMIAPGLGEADVPVRIRLAVALALVPLLLPLLAGQLPPQPEDIPGTLRLVVTELLVGLWIGSLARVVAMALSVAFQIVALAMGLASVLAPDAQMGAQTAILGRLGSLATAVLVLSTGLYAQPLRALADSYEVLPPGVLQVVTGVPGAADAQVEVLSGAAQLEVRVDREDLPAEAIELARAGRAEAAQADDEDSGVVADLLNQRSAFPRAARRAANGSPRPRPRRVSLYQRGP